MVIMMPIQQSRAVLLLCKSQQETCHGFGPLHRKFERNNEMQAIMICIGKRR